jgi:thymidylate synthase
MTVIHPELQYLDAMRRIHEEGVWVTNERTGERCLTVINVDFTYDVGAGQVPIVTTRKSGIKVAVAELLAYIRGYTSAEQFRSLGTKTWDANANLNKAWLANPNRKGEDDLGQIYGAVAKNWPKVGGGTIDLFHKVYNNLKRGVDDRGETITFWNPGAFDQGCLRPCMRSHTFSLVNGILYLTSEQRSSDLCLGTVANMPQVYIFLALMAQITGNRAGKAFHKNINTHIYEPQYELSLEQVKRIPLPAPTLWINPEIKTLEDLETWVTVDDFLLIDYQSHPAINYPFTV